MSRPISYFIVNLLVLGAAACTKPNPLDCSDGTCTDPTHPFCDVDGSLGDGTEATCIAVSCTPGTFATCRGDSALVCNPAGTSYDLTQCADGCDPTAGCRLCEANQTVCANGTLQTCDAAGAITASTTCPLGCFQDQPRCRDVDPSNDLAMYLNMAATAPDLTLVDGDIIYVDTAKIVHGDDAPVALTGTYLTNASTGGVPIRILVANRVQITGHVSIRLQNSEVGPALAIVANDQISVSGYLGFDLYPAPGGVDFPDCAGVLGGMKQGYAGGGGGGHATAGGDGGNVGGGTTPLDAAGGRGGKADGSPTLVPLRGGCTGGTEPGYGWLFGGGALQLSSRTTIKIHDAAILDLNGFAGVVETSGNLFSLGGGAGGGLLLEAPSVELGDTARLLVNGGGGTYAGGDLPTSLTTAPTLGQRCVSDDFYICSNGGDGAAIDGAATGGENTIYPVVNDYSHAYVAGSGGGGLGYIRINTATGNYTRASNTIESGVLTTGAIGTR